MYCRKCGNAVSDVKKECESCGAKPLNALKYCQECGAQTDINQSQCAECGARIKSVKDVLETEVISGDFSRLKDYYREEFTKINESKEAYKGKWNWSAFIFGMFWAFTKGLWLSAIVCFVANFFTGGLVGIAYSFIYASRGNLMYYNSYTKDKQTPL